METISQRDRERQGESIGLVYHHEHRLLLMLLLSLQQEEPKLPMQRLNTKRCTTVVTTAINQSINVDRQRAPLALSRGPMRAAFSTDAVRGTGTLTLNRHPSSPCPAAKASITALPVRRRCTHLPVETPSYAASSPSPGGESTLALAHTAPHCCRLLRLVIRAALSAQKVTRCASLRDTLASSMAVQACYIQRYSLSPLLLLVFGLDRQLLSHPIRLLLTSALIGRMPKCFRMLAREGLPQGECLAIPIKCRGEYRFAPRAPHTLTSPP